MTQSTQRSAPGTNFEKFKAITDNSLVAVYGPTGAGKSYLAIMLALEAIASGIPIKDINYVDAERNVTAQDEAALGKAYRKMATFDEMCDFGAKAPRGKLIVMDSPTLPILGQLSGKDQRVKGDLYLKLHSLGDDLKRWCAVNDALCVIILQDQSELGKYQFESEQNKGQQRNAQYWQDPVGGKLHYFCKEVFRLVPTRQHYTGSTSMLMAHKCRRYGKGASIADLTINNDGTALKWRVNPASSLPVLPGISEQALKQLEQSLSEARSLDELENVKTMIPWNTLTKEEFDTLVSTGMKRRGELEAGNDGITF
ncbi:MAG: ATP-binding protein [Candidatus Aquicultor sp.]|nr:ATP-binding protein [Candidatus Aquicultor sp.]